MIVIRFRWARSAVRTRALLSCDRVCTNRHCILAVRWPTPVATGAPGCATLAGRPLRSDDWLLPCEVPIWAIVYK